MTDLSIIQLIRAEHQVSRAELQQFRAEMQQVIKSAITEALAQQPAPQPETKFTGDAELAKYLGCTVQTISKVKKEGRLPFHRIGRGYYYLQSEVDNAFKGRRAEK